MIPSSLRFINSFHKLPSGFYTQHTPERLKQSRLCLFNTKLWEDIANAQLSSADLNALLTLQELCEGMSPIATVYAGHQFGHYVDRLGDGRALLMGEVQGQSQNWELQTKGSGQTEFSRMGDGKAVLRSTLREYLCSEAMHGLGIPTTRALALISSEEEVYRERTEKGAILWRTAQSHIRFGHFEYFFHTQQPDKLAALIHHTAALFEDINPNLPLPEKAISLYEHVVKRTAVLVAQWQSVGFCHGVMNTDNMSVLGLTLDYGPYGFLDEFKRDHVCNSSDHHARYSYDNQPHIAYWNLGCFAVAFMQICETDKLKAVLETYHEHFDREYRKLFARKVGLQSISTEKIEELLTGLEESQVDMTRFFRQLVAFQGPQLDTKKELPFDKKCLHPKLIQWLRWYHDSRQSHGLKHGEEVMNRANPIFVLRNYLAEIAIEEAENGDFSFAENLLRVLTDPFAKHADLKHLANLPPDWSRDISISCSS